MDPNYHSSLTIYVLVNSGDLLQYMTIRLWSIACHVVFVSDYVSIKLLYF